MNISYKLINNNNLRFQQSAYFRITDCTTKPGNRPVEKSHSFQLKLLPKPCSDLAFDRQSGYHLGRELGGSLKIFAYLEGETEQVKLRGF